MKITVIKKAQNSKVRVACPWIVEDYRTAGQNSK